MEPQPNRYAHLSEAELTALRYEYQDRYEQAFDFYHQCYEEWSVVMSALKTLMENRD